MTPLYNRWFIIAFLSQTCFVLANTLMAHYARWVEFLGGSVSQVGAIMGAGPIVGLLLRPWLGQWINRLGAKTSWLLGFVVFGASAATNLMIHELAWPLYVSRCLMVLGSAFVFASGLTYITQTAPISRRTEAIGSLGVAGFAGMLLGPISGDWILGEGVRTLGSFNLLFGITAAAMIPTVVLLLFLPAAPRSAAKRIRLRDFVSIVHRYWPGAVLLVNLSFGLAMTVPFGFLASYIDAAKLSFENGFSVIGYFFLFYASWAAALRIVLRRVPDRFGRRKVLLAGLFTMGLGMFTFPLVTAERTWLMCIPGIVCGTGHALVFHTMTALAIERFPSKYQGTGSAMALMALDLGVVGGSPLLGLIAQRVSFAAMFNSIGSFCLVSAVIYTISSIPTWRRAKQLSKAAETEPAPEEIADSKTELLESA